LVIKINSASGKKLSTASFMSNLNPSQNAVFISEEETFSSCAKQK
jgi:hypothetical protein